MRGLPIIGMMLAMMIVVYLTMTSMKKKVSIKTSQDSTEVAVPQNLTDLPATVQSKLNAAVKQDEEQRKAAEEALK